jgi:hypothetical protein
MAALKYQICRYHLAKKLPKRSKSPKKSESAKKVRRDKLIFCPIKPCCNPSFFAKNCHLFIPVSPTKTDYISSPRTAFYKNYRKDDIELAGKIRGASRGPSA